MWINRSVSEKLIRSEKSRPAILLTGMRQTGKSSLLKKLFKDSEYVSFDRLRYVEQAKESPEFFLSQFTDQIILDEIQYVPELFRELKIVIDEQRQQYGKWILTGSQLFELMHNVSESLAGRISVLHLETLSAEELRNAEIAQIEDTLWKGGYPELWSNELLDWADFFESYIRTYIERDLKTIIDVKNLTDFRRFFKIIATRVGQLISFRDISKDVGVSDTTIKSWINALQASGVIYLLPPFHANIGKRLTKTPKIYFADQGLLCSLLDIESMQEWHNHIHKGNLWENFVMMELIKTNNLVPGKNLFFYRDQNGVEIDFIVEKKGVLFLIEAKASERINKKKLNFSKVAPLMYDTYQTENLLAQNVKESDIITLKEYKSFNPLYYTYFF